MFAPQRVTMPRQYYQQPPPPQVTTQNQSGLKGKFSSAVTSLKQELKITPATEARVRQQQMVGKTDSRLDKLKGLINSM